MKKLITLAKELDFSNEIEYFEYLVDSLINGNRQQAKNLYKAMKKDDRKRFFEYLEEYESEQKTIDFFDELRPY